jgi:prepilin-type N-terminal cleavage/methylation domain-containing protein
MRQRCRPSTPKARPWARSRGGFTLVEVIVAVVLATVIVLGTRALADALASYARASMFAARRLDRDANAEHWMRVLVRNLDSSDPLAGDSTQTTFTSWCLTGPGWYERCAVRLEIMRVDGRSALRATTVDRNALMLPWRPQSSRFIYLRSGGSGGTWSEVWLDEIARPVALGVVLDADTLILRIGDRG